MECTLGFTFKDLAQISARRLPRPVADTWKWVFELQNTKALWKTKTWTENDFLVSIRVNSWPECWWKLPINIPSQIQCLCCYLFRNSFKNCEKSCSEKTFSFSQVFWALELQNSLLGVRDRMWKPLRRNVGAESLKWEPNVPYVHIHVRSYTNALLIRII